jgi:hypothetical protein
MSCLKHIKYICYSWKEVTTELLPHRGGKWANSSTLHHFVQNLRKIMEKNDSTRFMQCLIDLKMYANGCLKNTWTFSFLFFPTRTFSWRSILLNNSFDQNQAFGEHNPYWSFYQKNSSTEVRKMLRTIRMNFPKGFTVSKKQVQHTIL